MSQLWCKTCPNKITKTVTRLGRRIRKKYIEVYQGVLESHYHFGYPRVQYGLCRHYHFNKIKVESVEWRRCLQCEKRASDMKIKRQSLKEKYHRKVHRKVPTFLTDQLDRFEKLMLQDKERQEEANQVPLQQEKKTVTRSKSCIPKRRKSKRRRR